MKNIGIDSHKLIYHPETVANWLNGDNIYPIELEIGLTNACNHRCIFCAVDYTGYKPVVLDSKVLLDNLEKISDKGLKSIVYAGEGEPLLHKEAPEIINYTKQLGIDAALSTNGVLLTPEVSRECIGALTWIRFSVAGIKEKTYAQVQRGKAGDLEKVLANMQEAVRVKRDRHYMTTLGVQLLLLPENKDEIVEMGKELRKIGVDYFTIKPFSPHPQSHAAVQVDYQEMLCLEKELKELQTEDFQVYFRGHAMKKLQCKRCYDKCRALPFMVYLDAMGNLWPCIVFMGKDEYSYGNIYKESFMEIWEGRHRKEIINKFDEMDLEKNCRELCRLDEMNRYLHILKNPGTHVNFI